MKYFKDSELADKATGIVQLAPACASYPGFGARIDALRQAWGKPLIVNSCCRSKAHNAKVGGHPRSLHVYDFPYHDTGGAAAIDFKLMKTPEETEQFKRLAYSMLFSVGDEAGCIHCDDRTLLLNMIQARFSYTTNLIS